jgi:hypothetical protein
MRGPLTGIIQGTVGADVADALSEASRLGFGEAVAISAETGDTTEPSSS